MFQFIKEGTRRHLRDCWGPASLRLWCLLKAVAMTTYVAIRIKSLIRDHCQIDRLRYRIARPVEVSGVLLSRARGL